jgi:GT2 family glycosyltransferase
MKIGISLVNMNCISELKQMISSLLNSDIMNKNDIVLYYWDNNSTDGSVMLIKKLNVKKKIYENEKNHGIIFPRIKIGEDILNDKCDLLLEVHSDMIFPSMWFNELYSYYNQNVGILMPTIINGGKYLLSEDEINITQNMFFSDKKVYKNCLQVHPWLLNMNCVREIGYYKKEYGLHRNEDLDFMYNILVGMFAEEFCLIITTRQFFWI